MYNKILVTLDATPTDRAVIAHVLALATCMKSQVVLMHVADGWAARFYGADAASPEVREDQAYLNSVLAEFAASGVSASTELAFGNPTREIVRWVREHDCDLVAMSTHGHGFWGDFFFGTTASWVRHRVRVPVLLVSAEQASPAA